MTEASEAVNDYWFDALKFPRMRVPKAIANVASRRISEKNGMRIVATRNGNTSPGSCSPRYGRLPRTSGTRGAARNESKGDSCFALILERSGEGNMQANLNEVKSMRRMQSIAALVLLMILAVGFLPRQPSGQKGSDEAIKAEVTKVDDQLNQAIMSKDRATLDRLFSDKLSWIARGERLNKEQAIEDAVSGNLTFKSFAHDSIIMNVFGDTVVMSGHSTSDLIYKGREQNNPRLFTNVYVKAGGRWQMVSHQVSDLEKP